MRVIEPHYLQVSRKRRTRRHIIVVSIVAGLLLLVGGALVGSRLFAGKVTFAKLGTRKVVTTVEQAPTQVPAPLLRTLKKFTPNEFRDVYRAALLAYPNTEVFAAPPTITGNEMADQRIRSIAEARGFQLTRIPVTALVKTNEPLLKGQTDDLLQPLAFAGWQDIKAAAAKDGIPLALYSAYRSPEWQRDLFAERFAAQGGNASAVAAGRSDTVVQTTLGMTSIPGYSRHHTGYAVDFWCEDGTGLFGNSSCFRWLSKNNYQHAKEHGWIPSYPEGADEQGPEPEPWEYVWVGKAVLYE